MKNKIDFIALVDNRFFKHLKNNSLVPFRDCSVRKDFLESTYDKLLNNLTGYKPLSPREYISFPKNRYVTRMVPTFELEDYCIYYYCLKVLEDFIAENRVEGTFGGFRLGGKLREKESFEFEPSFEDSYNENSFNALAWKQEYGEYQAKLFENAQKMKTDFHFAVHFDIANFYDCIRLDLLEKKIRDEIRDNSCDDEIHLLFRFLKYWNNGFDSKKSVGIPQDEVGDCSRILSNFFLQDYDQFVFDKCKKKDAKFLRYADDQIIFTQSQEDAEELMYEISKKLFEEGLNINTGKTKEFTNFEEFDDVYGFSIFEKLKFDSQNVNEAFDLFVEKKKRCPSFRETSVLKRLLHKKIQINELENQKRLILLTYLWDESFLIFSNDHFFMQIYEMLKDPSEKNELLRTLDEISKKTNFTSFNKHYNKFLSKI